MDIQVGRQRDDVVEFLSMASFQKPSYIVPSAWHEHAPFLSWLIEQQQPETYVELGVHHGFSYFVACEAAEKFSPGTRLYGVDHWKGDEHAGRVTEDVYSRVQEHNGAHYARRSRLIRDSFENASKGFSPASIDLLHIDGRHYYDDVRHDCETWLPKLSDRAIVLFHDTNVVERGFGVIKYWSELKRKYSGFEFIHGHGLGVLFVGSKIPARLQQLADIAPNTKAEMAVREVYANLGRSISLEARTLTSPSGDRESHDSISGILDRISKLRGEQEQMREDIFAHLESTRRQWGETDAIRQQRDDLQARYLQQHAEMMTLRDQVRRLDCENKRRAELDVVARRLLAESQALANGLWSGLQEEAARRKGAEERLSESTNELEAVKKQRNQYAGAARWNQKRIEKRDGELRAIKTSTSWRLTAPLRAVRSVLRGGSVRHSPTADVRRDGATSVDASDDSPESRKVASTLSAHSSKVGADLGRDVARRVQDSQERGQQGAASVRGGLDRGRSATGRISGWVMDSTGSGRRPILLKIDGELHAECRADQPRGDLAVESREAVHCGFEVLAPSNKVDGKEHTIEVLDAETDECICKAKIKWNPPVRQYDDFESFLAASLTQPEVKAPFIEVDKRVFSAMEQAGRFYEDVASALDEKPLVTVMVPTYNRERTILAAVESVLTQTYSNIELMVIDDGSTDRTIEILESISDDRMQVIRNDQNCGKSACLNRAIDCSSGDLIAYLDSDNTWDHGYLAASVGALKHTGTHGVYSGQLLCRRGAAEPFSVRFGALNLSLLANRNFIDHNCLVHSRKVFDLVGGYDEDLRRCIDYDFILRLAFGGLLCSAPFLRSVYRFWESGDSITESRELVSDIKEVSARARRKYEEYAVSRIDDGGRLNHPITIVIPSWEASEALGDCLDSIDSIGDIGGLQVVIVDNNSSEDTRKVLQHYERREWVHVIYNNRNYGFSHAVNQGVKAGWSDSDVLLLNNDALINRAAIFKMQETAQSSERVGVVVPAQVLEGGTKTIKTHVPFADPDRDVDVNISSHHKNVAFVEAEHDGGCLEVKFAPFFCAYIRRGVWDAIGGLDAETGRHYRSDRTFCAAVRSMLDLRILHRPDALVLHRLQKSTDEMRLAADVGSGYDMMFRRNQWEADLLDELGFTRKAWDI